MPNKHQQDRIEIASVTEYMWGYLATYYGPLSAFLAANILPAEFYDFGGRKVRSLTDKYFEKRTGKTYPEGIHRAHGQVRKNYFALSLGCHLSPTEPIYIPPGDTWPAFPDRRFYQCGHFDKPNRRSAQIINFSDYRKPVRAIQENRLAVRLALATAERFGLGVEQTVELIRELYDILPENAS